MSGMTRVAICWLVLAFLGACDKGGGGGPAPRDDVVADGVPGDSPQADYPPPGVNVLAETSSFLLDPRIAAGSGGGAYAVWFGPLEDDLKHRLWFSQLQEGGWSPAAEVVPGGGYLGEASVWGGGTPTLSWLDDPDPGSVPPGTTFFIGTPAGSGWEAAEFLPSTLQTAGPGEPWTNAYLLDAQGQMHVLYNLVGDKPLYYLVIAGGVAGPPIDVSGTTGDDVSNCGTPSIAVTSDGRVHGAFACNDRVFYVDDVGDADGQAAEVPIQDSVGYLPHLATNGQELWLTWGEKESNDLNPAVSRAFYIAAVAGGAVGPAQAFPYQHPGASSLLYSLNVTVDAAGHPHTAQVELETVLTNPSGPYQVTVQHVALEAGAWTVKGSLSYASAHTTNVQDPWHSLNADGTADVLWLEMDGPADLQRLFHARL